ncbi:hypothetical protein TNIN_476721 [Trichonephila inaurata madagascariensis]|uniref:C2H2-type domain-containing protein n=1 Tax=Trichonephila inaurata madagascariensis TaxID=2747483 RepID=A0A8X6IE44_9ARAC|nr:hypothetical protein TNIN_476721 [Trichonephila inaurata madagascariensis]
MDSERLVRRFSETLNYRMLTLGRPIGLSVSFMQIPTIKLPWNESSRIQQPIPLLPWDVALSNFKERLWNSAQDQIFRCKECSAEFLAISHYTAHLVYHKEHHYDCEVCGKAFAKKTHLMQHKKMHSERNFICLKCGKTYSQKGCLKRHMLCHVMEERTRIKVEL